VIHGYMETWVPGYLIDEIVLRAEPTSSPAAILQRLGNLPQARIPEALPAADSWTASISSISASEKYTITRQIGNPGVGSFSQGAFQILPSTSNADRSTWRAGGTSADHPSISIFPKAHTESCPLPLSYSTAL
jgi:hypothetical protein